MRLHFRGQRESAREKSIPVSVKLMDEKEFQHDGSMSFVDNELSTETATIRTQAVLPNPSGFLTPGVFGRLRLPGTEEYEALLVPDHAVVSDQSRKIVLVVDEKGTVAAQSVDLGPLHDGLRVIRGGIGVSDRIIVKGVMRGRPGGKVTATEKVLQPNGTLRALSGS